MVYFKYMPDTYMGNPFIELNENQIQNISQENAIPSIFYIVFNDNKISLDKSSIVGEANPEQGAADLSTLIPIASLSKMITALITLRLVDDQKITLHDTVQMHIPELAHSQCANAKIQQLLSHTAGFTHDLLDIPYWTEKNSDFPDAEQLVAGLQHDLAYHSNPPETFKYSNINYALLGLILEKVTNKSYTQIATEYFILPLQLTDSTPDQKSLAQDQIGKLMYGYGLLSESRERSAIYTKPRDTKAFAPAAGWIASIGDIAKIIAAILDKKSNFLSEEMRFLFYNYFIPIDEARYYGLGNQKWVIETNNDWEVFGHFGWWFGVTTALKIDQNGNGLLTICNTIDDYSKKLIIPKSNAEDEIKELLEIPGEINSVIPRYFDPSKLSKYKDIWGYLYIAKENETLYLLTSPSTTVDKAMKLVETEHKGVLRVQNGHPLAYESEPVYLKKDNDKITEFIISSERYILEE